MTDVPLKDQPFGEFCSILSSRVGEQMAGTAVHTAVWLMLEYPYSWEAKAFEQSRVPKKVKASLDRFISSTPHVRLEFIKGYQSSFPASIKFFVCLSREIDPILLRFELSSYTDILDIDLDSLLAEPEKFQSFIHKKPLFLVCTHGRRDQCCARFGLPVYRMVNAHLADSVWQCTHVGGHRFAPNFLCFPHGIYYGRVSAANAISIIQAYVSAELVLANLRGRAIYPPVVQAAEYFLRMQTGDLRLSAFHLVQVSEISPGRWTVEFALTSQPGLYSLTISSQPSGSTIRESCGSQDLKEVEQFILDGFAIDKRG
jgi:hypothetical protein